MDRGDRTELPDLLPQPDLSLGLVACAPLFVLYELGLGLGGAGVGRNGAEELLTLALSPFSAQHVLRPLLLGVLLVFAWHHLSRTVDSRRHALGGVLLEGLVAALALGPVLIAMLGFFDARGMS